MGTRALIGSGRAVMEEGRLLDAEAAFRTAALADGAGSFVAEARRGLALVLCLRGRFDAAEEAVGSHSAAILASILHLKGDLAGAAHAVARAIREVPHTDFAARCEAHLAALRLHDALGQGDQVREHARLATDAARGARLPALRVRVAAEVMDCLERTGVPAGGARRRRILSAADRLPPLAARSREGRAPPRWRRREAAAVHRLLGRSGTGSRPAWRRRT